MAIHSNVAKKLCRGSLVSTLGLFVLAGCEEGVGLDFLKPKGETAEAGASAPSDTTVKLVERDVEAPEVFQVTDKGLWDGRPSLGGVWVAHPDVNEPERVIIRNTKNSKFVIGALFRRERDNPGPILQVSSDAAAALGMLAGAPVDLNVTALRRETEPEIPPEAAPTAEIAAPDEIEATTLDPVASAAAAIDAAESDEASVTPAPVPTPTPAPAPKPKPAKSSLEKPYLQIGIFSVEQNARDTATAMRQSGMVPTVKEQSLKGKKFWRVIVGPATSKSERNVLLKKIKGIGFDDAYPVTN